jgi:ribonuclease P protein component
LPHPRVGVVVPKHRHNSVQRNRLKRRIREIVRLEILPRLAQNGVNVEILIRARREAYEAAFAILRTELITWVERRWQLDSCSS